VAGKRAIEASRKAFGAIARKKTQAPVATSSIVGLKWMKEVVERSKKRGKEDKSEISKTTTPDKGNRKGGGKWGWFFLFKRKGTGARGPQKKGKNNPRKSGTNGTDTESSRRWKIAE